MTASIPRGGEKNVRIDSAGDRASGRGLRDSRAGTQHGQRRDVPRTEAAPPELTITVLIPAFNEEGSIQDTLDAVLLQTAPVERIIVVDDCSTDRTAELCGAYPAVEVIRTPQNAGSKARALNHVLPQCTTDLVMVIDGDATLASDYVAQVLPVFCDPRVTSAAGCVLSKNVRTPAERGRNIELLFSAHFHRPIQNKAGAPLVISGCATLYRLSDLHEAGGWTSQTVCEDVDYTWMGSYSA